MDQPGLEPLPYSLPFPKSFSFGAAVSSFQVEGNRDGTRHTDWDAFLQKYPDIVKPGEVGPSWWDPGVAERDIDRMAGLGLTSLRMSFEWDRIEPTPGTYNKAAVDRYHHMVDYAIKKGLQPMVTLNHFTLPEWAGQWGWWCSDKTAKGLANFAAYIVPQFPEVTHWLTINEPSSIIYPGYLANYFPPQDMSLRAAWQARTNMLLSNQLCYQTIKQYNPDLQVGAAFAMMWSKPEQERDKLERWVTAIFNYFATENFIAGCMPYMDFIGANYYTGYYVDLDFTPHKVKLRDDHSLFPKTAPFISTHRPDALVTDYGWPIVPEFLISVLKFLNKFKLPIYITENGLADATDQLRALYLITHLTAMWRAMEMGIDVRQYLYWAAVDNLEWREGYAMRFGLCEVDQIEGHRSMRRGADVLSEVSLHHAIHAQHLINTYVPAQYKATTQIMVRQLLSLTPANTMHPARPR